MMRYELQAARQAEVLSRAAQRRLVREAKQAAKAAKSARTSADSTPGPDSREQYVRTA